MIESIEYKGLIVKKGIKVDKSNVHSGLNISCGDYQCFIYNKHLTETNKKKMQYTINLVGWIKNPKVRVWLVTKLIKGHEWDYLLNLYFDKGHLCDKDYRDVCTSKVI